ncbi:MAG TPA: Trk system potassium transporter TrkA [Candidatus Mailhella excrementigallinarum]|nr:Trk system potassium transporter TrkA [Candidatus Mailhella excrementigallinarum]
MFFQRGRRTRAEADRIVIVGAGEVGVHISRRLAAEGKRVLIIDLSRERLSAVEEELDVQTLQGSGTTPSVLRRAEVENAAMFLAVTDSDEANIVSCLFAGELAPNLIKVARIRHPEYADMPSVFAREPLKINMMVNPEEEVVRSIERQLTLPGAMEYAEFADGTLRMASMRIEGEPLAGRSLMKFPELAGDPGLMVGAINRGGRLLIPSGRDTLEEGDVVYFVFLPGSQPSLLRLLRSRGGYPSSACIVGGGDIGFRLARLLERREVDVKIIDRDAARCEFLAEHLSDALVLHGDGTDADLLRQENVGRMDAFISVTEDEENNMLACLLARSLGVRETVVRVDKAAYLPLVEQVGIGHSVSPRLSAVNSILHYFRQGRILSSVAVGGEAAEMMEALVEGDSWLDGRAVHELGLPRGVLLIGVSRDGETRIPSGGTIIRAGDTIAILCLRARVGDLEKVLAGRKA